MHIAAFPLTYEERTSDPFVIPGGRLVTAELRVDPSGKASVTDYVRLVVEVREPEEDEFTVAAQTTWVGTGPGGMASAVIPGPPEPVPGLQRGPVARLVLQHRGPLMPRVSVRLNGW